MTLLPLFPLTTVLFPGGVLPIHIFEPRYRQMLDDCLRTGQGFGVVRIQEGTEVGGDAVPHGVGTLAEIIALERLPDGRAFVTVLGKSRFRIESVVREKGYSEARVTALEAVGGDDAAAWLDVAARLLEGLRAGTEHEIPGTAAGVTAEGPEAASFRIADALDLDDDLRQELLEIRGAAERLKRLASLITLAVTPLEDASHLT